MARVNIPVTLLTDDSPFVDPSASEVTADPTNDHSFLNNGRTILQVRNTAGSSKTFDVVTPNTVDGLAVSDRTVTVAAGKTVYVGPFPRSIYSGTDQDNSGERCLVNVPAAETDLRFKAYRI